jgi:glycosyltransferase involved in cell wall biosynthesis
VVIAGLGAGGAERVLSIITDRWIKNGREVWIISFDFPSDQVFHKFSPDIHFLRLGISKHSGRLSVISAVMRRIILLRSALKDIDPELVVSFLTKINVITLLSVLWTRYRVVISERNNPIAQGAHPAWNVILRKLSWRADAIVMQTRASLACLDRSARIRARVIPNPILLAETRPHTGSLVLAAVGRLTYQKGFDLLLDAFAMIAPLHREWKLFIWGDGEDAETLASKINAMGIDHQVKLCGTSRNPEEWVESASAFVLSSRYEGFGNVLAEAMVGGLPVVAYDCDFGPGEIIQNDINGLLVPAQDVSELASALHRIMGDSVLRSRLGSAARAVGQRYDPDAIVNQWEEVITRVAPQ